MVKKNKEQTLGYLGEDFQERLIKIFIEDKDAFKNDMSFINQNAFTNSTYKTIVGFIKDFVNKNDYIPSYELLSSLISKSISNEIELELIRETINKIKNRDTEGFDVVKEESLNFFKQQEMVKFFNENLDKLARGQNIYNGLQEDLNKIMTIGKHENEWSGVYDELDDTFSPESIIHIPIGCKEIDDYLQGGIIKGNLVLLAASSGIGKAQPLRELIATPEGFIKMGEIKVGDKVFGSDGKIINVTGVYPQGKRDVYRVYFKDKTFVDCDYEHLWNVNTRYQRVSYKWEKGISKTIRKENGKRITIGRTKQTDYSYKTMSLKDICEMGIKSKQGRKFKIPMLKSPVDFTEKYVNVNPYLFGYFIGDGSFGKCTISVGVEDYENCIKNLKNNNNYYFYPHFRKERNIWDIQCEKQLCHDLNEFFSIKTTNIDKYLPDCYLFNSIENRIELLNGLMDSDGTCDKNGRSSFSTKSKILSENIKTLVLSLGGYAIITSKKRGYFSKKYNKYIDCGLHYNVQITLCDSSIPLFKYKRKQDRVIYREKYKEDKYIDRVEYIGKEECQCIKVDSNDELYLTKDFIVTHNTTLSTAFAESAATFKCPENNFEGFKVMQIFFEDNKPAIRRKHMGTITQIEAREINTKEYSEIAKQRALEYEHKDLVKNNIRLGRFRNGELTPQDLKQKINILVQKGFKPDLIIIDYFECLANPVVRNITNEWKIETEKMRQLENLTRDFGCALVVTTQGTKQAAEGMLLTLEKISGSAGKYQVGHCVMTLNRTNKDAENNQAEFFIPKNREGKSGRIFRIGLNNGIPKITVQDSFDNIETLRDNQKKDALQMQYQDEYSIYTNSQKNIHEHAVDVVNKQQQFNSLNKDQPF